MSEFQYTLEYRAGNKHGNVDGLSRKGCAPECRQCNRIEERDDGPKRSESEFYRIDKIMVQAPKDNTQKSKIINREGRTLWLECTSRSYEVSS